MLILGDNEDCCMLANKQRTFFILLIYLTSCQAPQNANITEQTNKDIFIKSVSYLDPERPENQMPSQQAYGQIILTVENDDVIEDLQSIEEIKESIQEITFIKSNNSFESVVYLVQFKKSINPIPYFNFLQEYEGVVAAEFDGIVGLAGLQTPQDL